MGALGTAILVFLVSSTFVIMAGVGLARFGDALAEATGWGKLWVGTLLVGIATSLPELTVNVSAVWLENNPSLALGNVFGADMINIFVLASAALVFGVPNLFGKHGRDTELLILSSLGLVILALIFGALGDFKVLGPVSVGGLLIGAAYLYGMRLPVPPGRSLASSADAIAEASGISASFIGVLLVSIVTTLPEASVTVAASLRRSYGIAMGNVYGSNAFNIAIISIADLFHAEGPLLREMRAAHFAAAGAALMLMTMGYLVFKSCQSRAFASVRVLAPAIPVVYVGALYLVYTLGQACSGAGG